MIFINLLLIVVFYESQGENNGHHGEENLWFPLDSNPRDAYLCRCGQSTTQPSVTLETDHEKEER